MKNYIFIHGHFYQPPRENPWLEEIELQESARPYRNWNERITAECYAPNVASRILDEKGNIIDIVNNYSKISFNFGPTLLSWMQRSQPDVYLAILKADKSSQQYFSGHGGAIAQAYSHMIMPLANERDKRTQVIWGIRDFEFRFKRKPQGMWLPETAVDISTLEMLASYDIKFTILAPYQAKRIRKIGDKSWRDVAKTSFDIQRPYFCILPSGKKIAIFFYDGPISHDVAFAGLLNSGINFAKRLTGAFPPDEETRCVCCATDGETYGHHHRFGNMALSYCLHYIESNRLADLTVPSCFLEKFPPEYEVEIKENSSWSCAHGVERWRADCGCRIGTNAAWNQKWRQPLREALDWLRDQLIPLYENEAKKYCPEPWALRDNYIDLVLDRSKENIELFMRSHVHNELSREGKVKILKLLDMQRQAMMMYTSCGWFFDDIAGIESLQILQYAARAVQLANETVGVNLEDKFLSILANAPSNAKEWQDGAQIYLRKVKPNVIDLLNVGAHFAISSLFDEYPQSARIYSYSVDTDRYQLYQIGDQKLAISKARIQSCLTGEEQDVDFSVILFGDYNLHGCVRKFIDELSFEQMQNQLRDMFLKNEILQVVNQMNKYFGGRSYSLWDLFKNEQARVLRQIFNHTLDSVETHFREIYRHYYPLMQINPEFRIPVPKVLEMTIEFVLNHDLINILKEEDIDIERLDRLATEIKRWPFMRDNKTAGYEASRKIDTMMQQLARHSKDNELLVKICDVLRILDVLSVDLDLWKSQNIYFSLQRTIYPIKKKRGNTGDEKAREWLAYFDALGTLLKMKNK